MIWFQVAKETDWRLRRGTMTPPCSAWAGRGLPPGGFLGGQGRPLSFFQISASKSL